VPLNKELRASFGALKVTRNAPEPREHIIHSERDLGMSANAVIVWFQRLYASLGHAGASSHSLCDVEELVGHAGLQTTQRYIQGDSVAKRKVGDLFVSRNMVSHDAGTAPPSSIGNWYLVDFVSMLIDDCDKPAGPVPAPHRCAVFERSGPGFLHRAISGVSA
jgi:hypothetical protein